MIRRGRSAADRRRHRRAGALRRSAEPVVWWGVLFGFYLCVISAVSPTELIIGTATAGTGAAAAVATRRTLLRNLPVHRPRPGWFAPLPRQIPRDCARLLRPRPGGMFAELPLGPPEGRGVATLMLSTSPGTYVVRIRPEDETFLVHRIGERTSPLERRITSC